MKNENVFKAAELQTWQHIISEFSFNLCVKNTCKVKYGKKYIEKSSVYKNNIISVCHLCVSAWILWSLKC